MHGTNFRRVQNPPLHYQSPRRWLLRYRASFPIAETEQENQRLQEALDQVDTDEGVTEIARQKLGLVKDGEIVFNDVGN